MGIHWHISKEEAQTIVNILAQRPYVEVANLIADLLRQSQESPPGPELKPHGGEHDSNRGHEG